jgi:hypothetical protein
MLCTISTIRNWFVEPEQQYAEGAVQEYTIVQKRDRNLHAVVNKFLSITTGGALHIRCIIVLLFIMMAATLFFVVANIMKLYNTETQELETLLCWLFLQVFTMIIAVTVLTVQAEVVSDVPQSNHREVVSDVPQSNHREIYVDSRLWNFVRKYKLYNISCAIMGTCTAIVIGLIMLCSQFKDLIDHLLIKAIGFDILLTYWITILHQIVILHSVFSLPATLVLNVIIRFYAFRAKQAYANGNVAKVQFSRLIYSNQTTLHIQVSQLVFGKEKVQYTCIVPEDPSVLKFI